VSSRLGFLQFCRPKNLHFLLSRALFIPATFLIESSHLVGGPLLVLFLSLGYHSLVLFDYYLLSNLPFSVSFQQQPVTEGYQYSQLSPSRSPNGPTYTQLSGGARAQAYPVSNPGLWGGWQQNQGGPEPGCLPQGVVGGHPHHPGGQEMSDMMMQMLDQSGVTSFEDLNMFSTTFE
jgi:hypothetical protein